MYRVFTIACALFACASAGCTDGGEGARDASGDGVVIEPPGDGALGGDGADDGGDGIRASFRVAHLSPDLGVIDLCFRPSASQAWEGPFFVATPGDAGAAPDSATLDASSSDAATDASLGDASFGDASTDAGVVDAGAIDSGAPASGFGFATVTRYVTAHGAGTFDIAIVAASDASCSKPIALGHATVDAGKRATIVVMGLARATSGTASALAIAAFTDDDTPSALAIAAFTDDDTPSAGNARARFIHAALAPATGRSVGPLAIAAVTGGTSIPLAGDVEPARAATSSEATPKIDALGYGTFAPLTGTTSLRLDERVDASARTFTLGATDVEMSAATVHSGFVFVDANGAMGVLWCSDSSTATPITRCSVLR